MYERLGAYQIQVGDNFDALMGQPCVDVVDESVDHGLLELRQEQGVLAFSLQKAREVIFKIVIYFSHLHMYTW
jgi:hypothetical protein